jgi:hypothetical protein
MANLIKIKRSTANSAPASLEFGELALYSNGGINKIYVGNSSNNVVTLFDSAAGSLSSFQTTLSGLTPSSETTGAVTLSGTLGVANGGTGTNTSPTAGGIIFGKTTSAYGSTNAGTAGQFLISNGAGTPVWSSTISEDSGGGVILTGGTRGNFNLGSAGKSVGSPSNGDFWWNSSDNTLRFFPNSSGSKVLAYTSDIPTVNDATLTLGVSGTGLSGSATFTANDANNATFTVTSNANSSNGSGTIVARDSSGNFSANTITASLSGNASTASAWQTARTITLGGDLTGNVSINGSSNVTLNATVAANSVALGTDTTGNYVAGISGTTNEIEVSGSGSEGATVTIGLPDSVNITSNLTVGGDLTVNGNTVTVNTSTLSVEDPLIKLALGSTTDSLDIGFYGVYESGEEQTYTGFFRDQTDNKYKLFTGLKVEPTTTVNTSGTGYTVGTLVANLEGSLANATGLPISTGVSGLGTNVATFLANPTSANLISAVTGETGSGALVFATSPTLETPTLGVATATSINKVTITAPATSATLTLANGSSLITSGGHSLTLTTSGATNVTLPTSGTLVNSGVATLSSLASIGTITTGIWNGSTIAVAYGGTGTTNGSITGTTALTFTAGGTNEDVILRGSGTGGVRIGTGATANNNKLIFPGSTSGTITIVPTGVAGTTTLTLPAITGTVLTNNSTLDGGTY